MPHSNKFAMVAARRVGAWGDMRAASKEQPGSANPPAGMPAAAGERWYVVHTRPHAEFRAQSHLAAQGFRTFLPRYAKTVRHARRMRSVNTAFFPRYLFVALDLERHRWRSINGTFGVVSMVMNGVGPRPVPGGVVENLLAMSDSAGVVRFGDGLELGETVRVLSGPFADLMGRLVRFDGAGRVRVLLSFLGGEVAASIDRNDLMPARAA